MKNTQQRELAHKLIATLFEQKKDQTPVAYAMFEKQKEQTADMIMEMTITGRATSYETAITALNNDFDINKI